ncbi:uncharacterized protein LOC117145206 [Drosophila mauritiana]|uniref:Uncharacterized protein LOC117145206 n=1 Tax=Drosophila mauritiana TaxID=7226 RepID=A0A6P8KTZ1_DROMA|nr:uncharacterized protein LOC117145206 [Drosophila mauritiana]
MLARKEYFLAKFEKPQISNVPSVITLAADDDDDDVAVVDWDSDDEEQLFARLWAQQLVPIDSLTMVKKEGAARRVGKFASGQSKNQATQQFGDTKSKSLHQPTAIGWAGMRCA